MSTNFDLSAFRVIEGPKVVRPINAQGGLYMLVMYPQGRQIREFYPEAKRLAEAAGFNSNGATTEGFASRVGLDSLTTAIWFHDQRR